jgi:CheY-specific phosphatase CheX
MTPNEVQAALVLAVEEILETMCFQTVLTSAEASALPNTDSDGPSLTAEVRFQGNRSGRFRVGVPIKLARLLGAAFLGREEAEVPDSDAAEVVCELANMICGSVLSRLERQATFEITHPELIPPGRGVSFEGDSANRWFDLEDGMLAVSLELQWVI